MIGIDLARLLGKHITPSGRQRLQSLVRGESSDVVLRYDEVTNWDAVGKILIDHVNELQLFDGQEWFTIEIEELVK